MDNIKKVLEVLGSVDVFYLATSVDGKPNVRPFDVHTDFEGKVYLVTKKQKNVYKELKEKGVDVSYDETLADVIRRDKQDEKQSKAAEDSILLDNSELDFNGTVKRLLEIVEERTGVKHG